MVDAAQEFLYGLSIFHLYTGFFGNFEIFLQRFVHVWFVVVLIFLMYPYKSKYILNGIIRHTQYSQHVLLVFELWLYHDGALSDG